RKVDVWYGLAACSSEGFDIKDDDLIRERPLRTGGELRSCRTFNNEKATQKH
ncbi:hypothetical protein AVEN_152430-1, partial [Araneus ventricosus]